MSDDENDSGTGWPGAVTEPMPTVGPSPTTRLRTVDGGSGGGDGGSGGGATVERRGFLGRWFGRFAFLAFAVVILVLVLVSTNLVGLWHFANPFATRKT